MTEAELDEDVSAAGYAPLATDLAAEVTRRQIELGPAVLASDFSGRLPETVSRSTLRFRA